MPILLQQFLDPTYTHTFLMQNFKLAKNKLKDVEVMQVAHLLGYMSPPYL